MWDGDQDETSVHDWVRTYYGETLKHSDDLKTNACCATGAPPTRILRALDRIHPDVLARFYGCGFPIPEAVEGKVVADLGCGTGRDVYLLSQFVGESGFVHGVDMTASQLAVATETESWHQEKFGYQKSNVAFHQGYIEELSGLKDESVDVVVSNCVVNLSPRKDLVLKEIFRVLRPGGEFYFSDVFVDRRLPDAIATDPLLHSECLGGALDDFDFEQMAKAAGFLDPRVITRAPITIQNDEIEEKVGAARFTSVTLRLFKLEDLEARCEDYGQLATYRREIPGVGKVLTLDHNHLFELGRPERVCGNTAAMLRDTRFAAHFDVVGDTATHFGVFDCGPTMAAQQYQSDDDDAACC